MMFEIVFAWMILSAWVMIAVIGSALRRANRPEPTPPTPQVHPDVLDAFRDAANVYQLRPRQERELKMTFERIKREQGPYQFGKRPQDQRPPDNAA
jgi:hypothetical protein